ncbi:Asp-tRNA(Asn)/Glu-tRNA(Gln) amidotransferase subunit GatB [bacterium]|nr:Asp-tRNA(Asn)/Glu-tRNA(Gln) amidotransferase subunit GatB [bacterium]
MNWEAVIGLEVHAQLLTETKMFCGCGVRFGAEPNTQTCPVCLGLPGSLPVANRKAVELGVRLALAVNAEVRETSLFARKHYFYPDLPKGYQISQYEEPLCEHGILSISAEDGSRRDVRIRRIHLEEDAGKLVHDESYVGENDSLVDLNRCGTPLAEIVTEPDLRSPREAALFLTALRRLVRWLGVCDGNMEEGSLRCDANVSLRPAGSDGLGVKTEIKNMNSIRGVERALAFEIARQTRTLTAGGRIRQETLLWDEARGEASAMRGKEEAHDYRYFPDPDLPPLIIGRDRIEAIRSGLPELPENRKSAWMSEYGLSEYDASLLSEERLVADYFEELARLTGEPKASANWVTGDVLRVLNEKRISVDGLKIRPAGLAKLQSLVAGGKVSRSAAKKIFEETAMSGEDPESVLERTGLAQVSDEQALASAVREAVESHPEQLKRYLAGNAKMAGFFMGEIMKITRGRANPQMAGELLNRHLEGLRGK